MNSNNQKENTSIPTPMIINGHLLLAGTGP